MGLFCSLIQEPGQEPGRRLLKKDVTTPLHFTLSLFSGHVTSCDEFFRDSHLKKDLLASAECHRWYMGPGVRRTPLTGLRQRGTLFVPKGEHLVFCF